MTTMSRRIRKYERPFFYAVTGVIVLSFFVWTAPFSDDKSGEAVGTIAGEPVMKGELDNVRYGVDILVLLDGFSRSPALSASFARGRWMQTLLQARQALRNPQMRGFYLQYLGLGDVGDITSYEAKDALAWKWLAYLRAAEKAGFSVTDGEVSQFIRTITRSLFGTSFPKDVYLQVVESRQRGLGMHVATFELTVKHYLLAAKYFDAVGAAAAVTSEEILDAYLEENREVELAWMGFSPKDHADAPEPSREAVARHFRDRRGQYSLPAKARVEYLLAEPSSFKDGIEAPTEADITTRYESLKQTDYRNPDGGKDGKPEFKTLEEVREEIVKDLNESRASLKASEALQKVLLEIGRIEAKQREDKSVTLDFAALAKQFNVTCGDTPFFAERQLEDAEDCFGAFTNSRDREAFRRKIFTDMKDGEVMRGEMRPLNTEKGWIIYRLLQRKASRPRTQLTAEVEDDILRQLRKQEKDKKAVEAARAWVDAINADGLEKTETARKAKLHRPPAVKKGEPIPDPDDEHEHLSDGGRIVETAFELREGKMIGKARLLDTGLERSKYAVVLLKALEAKMDELEKQKPWLRERLLMNGFKNGRPVPGKRQLLIDARRAEIEKMIVKTDSAEDEKAPEARSTPSPAPKKGDPALKPETKPAPVPPKTDEKAEPAPAKTDAKADPAQPKAESGPDSSQPPAQK